MIARKAESFLAPPIPMLTTNHTGEMKKTESLISSTMDHISITAVKMAEDEKGIILRCVELNGKAAKGKISIPSLGREVALQMKPCEIKTIYIPFQKNDKVREVNLIEE